MEAAADARAAAEENSAALAAAREERAGAEQSWKKKLKDYKKKSKATMGAIEYRIDRHR